MGFGFQLYILSFVCFFTTVKQLLLLSFRNSLDQQPKMLPVLFQINLLHIKKKCPFSWYYEDTRL